MRQEEGSMVAPSFNDLPDVHSELFEQVTYDELALLDYYRALRARPTRGTTGSARPDG